MMASKKNRAPELDFLRGFALFMMILMHFAWDVHYEFGVKIFGFLEADWFWAFAHPFFIVIFVGVSGVCCTFSKNNLIRGLKLLGVAAVMTLATWLITTFMKINCLIIFNVLALLAVSILLYSLIEFIEKKTGTNPKLTNALLGFCGALITAFGTNLDRMDYTIDIPVLLPVGIVMRSMPYMADYMPMIPWVGVFLIGCLVGRVCYAEKTSLLPAKNKAAGIICAPFEFCGRHSLIIYFAHQPIVYGILFVIFMLIRH
jgi:uncharacterized membrane protein